MDVEAEYEKHHQREQDGEGNDCRCFIGEEGDGNAAAGTERPDDRQDNQGPPQCHDVVVPQSVEDSDVPVCCNGQQAENRPQQRQNEHGIHGIIQFFLKVSMTRQVSHFAQDDKDVLQSFVQAT